MDWKGKDEAERRARKMSAVNGAPTQAGLRSTSTSVYLWMLESTRFDKTTAINFCGVRYLRRDRLPNEFFMWLNVSSHACVDTMPTILRCASDTNSGCGAYPSSFVACARV